VGHGTAPTTGWYISDDFWVFSEAADLISERNFQFLLNIFTLCKCEPFHLQVKTVVQKSIFWKGFESLLSLGVGISCITIKISVPAAKSIYF